MNNFILSQKSKCLIATPVNHLPEVREYLSLNKDHFTINEKASKLQIIEYFQKDPNLSYLFVNPNAQGYFIDEEILGKVNIKGINTCSTGTNHIDLEYCENNKIKVESLKTDYELINNLPSTSELAFNLMLGLFRKLILCNYQVLDKESWDYTDVMGNQLSGKTIGCLGYGRLGKIFCKQLSGFDVQIQVCEEKNIQISNQFKRVSINKLFRECDAIAIHIHSCKQNKNLINKKLLSNVKKEFILVNTSRGDICDENLISQYLLSGKMGGYGTDVLSTEFSNFKDSPIYKIAKTKSHNVIITPHVGGMTYEGQSKAFIYALKKFQISN